MGKAAERDDIGHDEDGQQLAAQRIRQHPDQRRDQETGTNALDHGDLKAVIGDMTPQLQNLAPGCLG